MYSQEQYNGKKFVPQPTTLCNIQVRSVLVAINAYNLILLICGAISHLVQRPSSASTGYAMLGVSLSFLILFLTFYTLHRNGPRIILIVLTGIKVSGLLCLAAVAILMMIHGRKVLDGKTEARPIYFHGKLVEYAEEPGNAGDFTSWFHFFIVLLVVQILMTGYDVYLMVRYIRYLGLKEAVDKASYEIFRC